MTFAVLGDTHFDFFFRTGGTVEIHCSSIGYPKRGSCIPEGFVIKTFEFQPPQEASHGD